MRFAALRRREPVPVGLARPVGWERRESDGGCYTVELNQILESGREVNKKKRIIIMMMMLMLML